jgi:hypothetical protein
MNPSRITSPLSTLAQNYPSFSGPLPPLISLNRHSFFSIAAYQRAIVIWRATPTTSPYA